MNIVFAVIVVALAIIPFPATIANAYLWLAYRSSQPRSWILRDFAVAATAINLVAFFIGFLALRRLLGEEALDWSPTVSALGIVVLEAVPIFFAVEFRQRRAAHRRSTD